MLKSRMNSARMNSARINSARRNKVHLNKAQNIVPAVQDLAREWVGRAAEGSSSQANAVIRWALARIDHADVPSVVYGVVLTLTGNKKAAKEARRTAAEAVRGTTAALGRKGWTRKSPRRSASRGGWLFAVAGLIVGAGAVYAWRTVMPFGEPPPVNQPDTPPHEQHSPE